MNSAWIKKYPSAFLLAVHGVLAFAIDGTEVPDRPSTREPDVPKILPNQPPPNFSLPPAPTGTSPVKSEKTLVIHEFAFEGHTAFKTEELQRIAAPFLHKPVSIADLEELRQRLTHYYIDHGYINSGAVVPPKPLHKGVFRYQIIEGQLDGIRLKGQGRLRDGYIKNRLLKDGTQAFNINALQEHFQLLLTDPLIARMNGRIQPGAAPGHSVLDVDVTRTRPYQFSLFGNNYRPPSIGGEGGGANGSVRNLTGLGDFLNLSFTISEGSSRYFGHWNTPVNDYGTQIYFQFDEGNSSVIEEPLNTINIDSKVHNLEGGISHPFIDSLKRRFTMGGAFAVRENETRLLGEPFSFVRGLDNARNQATVVRLFQDWVERWERQAMSLRSTFSVGLDALGSTPERNIGNPDSEFFAWLGQAQFVHRVLDNGAQMVFRTDVQLSNEALLPLEKIAVGGIGSVRGYRANQLVRDEGYSGSLEFYYPLYGGTDPNVRHRLALVPFMDYGAAWNHGGKTDDLHAVGIGFNWTFYRLHSDFYWAYAIKSPSPVRHDDIQDEGIYFQVRLDAF